MKPYTYEARPGGFWNTTHRFTVESACPLGRGDVFSNEGKTYRVTYTDQDDAGVQVLVVVEERATRRRSRKARPGASSTVVASLGAIFTDLPAEHRALLERQLRRLVDLYRPAAGAGA